ncbi:MAG: multidrug efflux MFS transporter, partial [Betaproteobacteria bacterium]|nr:multidrug efflux MFS transporter [Betaproteobacteria bacterium]
FVYSMLFHGNIPVISIFTLQLIEADPAAAAGRSEEFWVGAMAVALAVSSIAALFVGGRLLDRLGASRVLAFTTAAAALTHLPLLLIDTPLALLLLRVAFGLSVATMQPALFRAIKDLAPAGMDGRAISYASSFQMIGMGMAPFLAGVIGPAFGLRSYFALAIAITAAAFALWLRNPRGQRRVS